MARSVYVQQLCNNYPSELMQKEAHILPCRKSVSLIHCCLYADTFAMQTKLCFDFQKA